MKNNTILIAGIILLFSACSQKDYKHMYTEQYTIFDTYGSNPHTSSENNVKTMQNGQNPMKRPSYEEYQEK